MESEQANANEAVARTEATTGAAIQAMTVATLERPQNVGPKMGGPAVKQPNFNWEADDKYNELGNFMLEINDIHKSCNTPHANQLAIAKNWLGRKVYNS